MLTTTARRGLLGAVLLTSACATTITHDRVAPPKLISTADAKLAQIGRITNVVTVGDDTVYAAGQTGLARLDAKGRVAWAVTLPVVLERFVDADAQGVAVSSFSVSALEPVKGLDKFRNGAFTQPEFEATSVALYAPDGKPLWTTALAQPGWVSPPALHSKVVGVHTGAAFSGLDRASGKETAVALDTTFMDSQIKPEENALWQLPRERPAVVGDVFFAGFNNRLAKVGIDGKLAFIDTSVGNLLTGVLFGPIAAGPVRVDDSIALIHTGRDAFHIATFTNVPEKGANFPLTNGGLFVPCFDLIATRTQLITSCFQRIITMGRNGGTSWSTQSPLFGDGATNPTEFRTPKEIQPLPLSKLREFRRDVQRQFAATDDRLFFTATYQGHDAVTVLDAKTGAYVATIDVGEPVTELAMLGEALVVATNADVRIVEAP